MCVVPLQILNKLPKTKASHDFDVVGQVLEPNRMKLNIVVNEFVQWRRFGRKVPCSKILDPIVYIVVERALQLGSEKWTEKAIRDVSSPFGNSLYGLRSSGKLPINLADGSARRVNWQPSIGDQVGEGRTTLTLALTVG